MQASLFFFPLSKFTTSCACFGRLRVFRSFPHQDTSEPNMLAIFFAENANFLKKAFFRKINHFHRKFAKNVPQKMPFFLKKRIFSQILPFSPKRGLLDSQRVRI